MVLHMENHSPALDSIFHALSDPTRRAVLRRLGQGPAAITELAAPFDMGLPAFLKHVGVLEEAGLVASRKSGRVRTCTLQAEALAAAERWFDEQRAIWAGRYDNLDSLLATLGGQDNDA